MLRYKEKRNFWEDLYIGETGILPLDWISDKFYVLVRWFYKTKEMLERMVYWGWKMRWSWDFEAHMIYDLLHNKLERLYVCFRDHSHCVWNSSEKNNAMRKLKEASMLAKRLYEDNYDIRAFEETDQRFEYYDWTEPVNTNNKYSGSYWRSSYKRTPKRAELFRKGRDKIYQKQKKHEKERLFKLMNQYLHVWWD